MKMLKGLLIYIWKLWFYFLTSLLVILIGLFWTFPFALSNKTFPLAYKGIRLWAILSFYGAGFRLDFEKNKKLDPKQPYIFISNHTSLIDVLIMAIIHPDHPIVFVGKAELENVPIFGTIYKRICISVNRTDTTSKSRVFRLAKEKINLGNSLVIFPEGGIPDDRNLVLDEFKDGAISIAIATKVPIVVYSIHGLKEMFPWSFENGYPGRVKVKLLDIIPTENLSLRDKDSVKESIYQTIYQDLIHS
jgi:1-acyl-sn-glycerol-3-phosphate acyltransferase